VVGMENIGVHKIISTTKKAVGIWIEGIFWIPKSVLGGEDLEKGDEKELFVKEWFIEKNDLWELVE
jgi:hypothetical protein